MTEIHPMIHYYREIERQATDVKPSTGEELSAVLRQIDEMETNYQDYLKTHHWFIRIFVNLCWWRSSVRGSYVYSLSALVGRVALGYENKMISLLACKHLLLKPIHRAFCDQTLRQAISNTYTNKDIRGFVWKVVNSHGITNYLIGTIHTGTKNMAKAKGVQEALSQSEHFFTEKGLLSKYWRFSHYPLYTLDLRFSFILDRYIALGADVIGKPNLILDHDKLMRETKKKVKEIKKNEQKSRSIDFGSELPYTEFFGQERLKLSAEDPRLKKIQSEVNKVFLVQSIQAWQKGDESEHAELDKQFMTEAKYVLSDEKTKAWLQHSYESLHSEKPLPGLIEQIRNAQKPICIAVGTFHCIGSRVSLVEEFQKAGFAVSRCE